MKKSRGFTLIEVMIVVAIIGILTAIAYPSYLESVRKSNRADAKAALNDVSARMQRCFTLNSTYVGCTVATESGEKYYSINSGTPTQSAFTITATAAKAPQTGDVGCTTMTLNNFGVRTPAETASLKCW